MSSFGSACLPEVEVCRGHFLKLLVGRGGGGGGGGGGGEEGEGGGGDDGDGQPGGAPAPPVEVRGKSLW